MARDADFKRNTLSFVEVKIASVRHRACPEQASNRCIKWVGKVHITDGRVVADKSEGVKDLSGQDILLSDSPHGGPWEHQKRLRGSASGWAGIPGGN
jgi:hypothetical protein